MGPMSSHLKPLDRRNKNNILGNKVQAPMLSGAPYTFNVPA